MAVIEVSVSNGLVLSSGARSNFKIAAVSSNLSFSSKLKESPKSLTTSNILNLRDIATYTTPIKSLSVSSYLTLTQATHPRTHIESVSSFLALSNSTIQAVWEKIASNLALSQQVSFFFGHNVRSNVAFNQQVIATVDRSIALVSSLNLESFATAFVAKTIFNAGPVLPTYSSLQDVVFSYNSKTLTLPTPDVGNSERLDFERINRRSRGNTLILYRDPEWPETKTLTLSFSWIKNNTRQSILDFLEETLGRQISYTDQYGQQWQGFIMTPSAALTQDHRDHTTVTLEFQGDKI